MQKAIRFLGIIFFALIFGCVGKSNKELTDKFVLKGNVDGIESETWIYLSIDNKVIDSAKIDEKKFELTGNIIQPKEFNLFIKNTQNYSSVWLEPGEIKFEAKNEAFRQAKITGSKSQIENEKLWTQIWEYRKKRDSLTNLVTDNKINDSIKVNATLELKKVRQNRLTIEKEFIKNNPNSYVSAKTLDFYATSLNRNTVSDLYDNFSENVKNSTYGQSIRKFLELNKNIQIGDKYIDFSMTDDQGRSINLSDYAGQLILLDFWASWCGPCIAEYPALRNAYSKFNKDGFEIVSISEDQIKERWIEAIEINELNWVNLWQEDGNKADPYLIYGINGIPDNFLINESGIIVARNLRGDKLISAIEQNLGNKARR